MSASEHQPGNEPAELQEQLDKALEERDQYRKLYELSREEVERLKCGLTGQKAERLPDDVKQLSLQVLGLALQDAEKANEPKPKREKVKAHTRTKPTGKKPLPDNLPLVEIELVPDEVKQNPDAWELIGEEIRETLERRPSSMVRVVTKRPKFVPKDRPRLGPTKVIISEVPELPIERGSAGPGLLADTIVRRWDDHMPLNRLERSYAREGVELARSTICGWHDQLASQSEPLIAAMFEDAYNEPYLCTDATGVLVQAKNKCRSGHFWVLVVPDRHILFRYSDRHDSQAVDELLKGYEGYLVADAHVVYDHLYKDGPIIESGCWSHNRRYYFKALDSDPDRAKIALGLIRQLFRIERTIAHSPRKKKKAVREEQSKPIVTRFFEWCRAERDEVLASTPIATAIGYSLNQEDALRRFLEDGALPIHNNISERELRRQVIGRKNWMFLGSRDGAVANTTFTSLLASCRLHGVEPWAYLRDLFCLLPSWPSERIIELAPVNWCQTLQDEETQRQLDANIYRMATIMDLDAHETAK